MHLCIHSKTVAKVLLFSETAKQNIHFANSHFAKERLFIVYLITNADTIGISIRISLNICKVLVNNKLW